METDFFQTLRRVQKEERNKSTLARVDNDFYKKLNSYVRNLECSVANDPFSNEQLLLGNAQRIATEICELRESKISKAAINNIYRSFHLFKKDNPQFDLLDTTPLNLTREEETLYFSLMDAFKSHRYNVSLDKYKDEATKPPETPTSGFGDVDQDNSSSDSGNDNLPSDSSRNFHSNQSNVGYDEGLKKLNDIKNAKVVTDEKRESIEKQINRQRYSSDSGSSSSSLGSSSDSDSSSSIDYNLNQDSNSKSSSKFNSNSQYEDEKSGDEKSNIEDDVGKIYSNPDSQFVDLDKLEHNYDELYDSLVSEPNSSISNFATPTDDDFKMIFTNSNKSLKKSGNQKVNPKVSKNQQMSNSSNDSNYKIIKNRVDKKGKGTQIQENNQLSNSSDDKFGFSLGVDVKRDTSTTQNIDSQSNSTDFANNKSTKLGDSLPRVASDTMEVDVSNNQESFAIKKPLRDYDLSTVIITKKIGRIMGIDEKAYGPFLVEDVVCLPESTAKVLIDNNKASLINI